MSDKPEKMVFVVEICVNGCWTSLYNIAFTTRARAKVAIQSALEYNRKAILRVTPYWLES